MAIINQYFT